MRQQGNDGSTHGQQRPRWRPIRLQDVQAHLSCLYHRTIHCSLKGKEECMTACRDLKVDIWVKYLGLEMDFWRAQRVRLWNRHLHFKPSPLERRTFRPADAMNSRVEKYASGSHTL